MDIKKTEVVTRRVEIRLTGDAIVELLIRTQYILRADIQACSVSDLRVTFEVPGGGDYSYSSIAIDEDNCITVSYETED